jgi:hypothetical protein
LVRVQQQRFGVVVEVTFRVVGLGAMEASLEAQRARAYSSASAPARPRTTSNAGEAISPRLA